MSTPSPAPPRPRLSPRKLLHGKWTAVTPLRREKHFLVTRVIEHEPPATPLEFVEIEAVYSKRVRRIAWRELTDVTKWRQGWL